jgi:hypothetical protein
MFYGVLTETLLMVLLLYCPGVNGVFGGRYNTLLTQTIKLLPVMSRYVVLSAAAVLVGESQGTYQHEE